MIPSREERGIQRVPFQFLNFFEEQLAIIVRMALRMCRQFKVERADREDQGSRP